MLTRNFCPKFANYSTYFTPLQVIENLETEWTYKTTVNLENNNSASIHTKQILLSS